MPTIYYFALSTKETMSPTNQHTEKIEGIKKVPKDSGLVVMSGFEPPTHGFSVRCSTN